MQIEITSASGVPVVCAHGRLVGAEAAALLRAVALTLTPGQPLVLDLTGIEVIDGDGIRAVELAARQAHTESARFAVAGSGEVVSALTGRLAAYPDRAAACAEVAASPYF
jgi:anti-anti-sigma regulatory factor